VVSDTLRMKRACYTPGKGGAAEVQKNSAAPKKASENLEKLTGKRKDSNATPRAHMKHARALQKKPKIAQEI